MDLAVVLLQSVKALVRSVIAPHSSYASTTPLSALCKFSMSELEFHKQPLRFADTSSSRLSLRVEQSFASSSKSGQEPKIECE
jgi:hypothetical protein